MRKTITFAVLLWLSFAILTAAPATAQKLEAQPGYVPIHELGIFPRERLSAEINLSGPLLRMIAGASRSDDPEFAALLSGLQAIQVQVFPLAATDEAAVKGRIGNAVRWLEDRGWAPTVRVREGGEEVYIYLKEAEGRIVGMTLMSLTSGDEAAVINIVGRIDPEQLSRLGEELDLPHLDRVPDKDNKDNQDKKP
ncbi:MAG TPA: DUF4252 domain-containing protein [Thermoanaerobaculia bacterium]